MTHDHNACGVISWKLLDDQSTIKEHLMHEPLHIDEHKDMTVGEIFTQLNCQRRYKKAFKPPLKASNVQKGKVLYKPHQPQTKVLTYIIALVIRCHFSLTVFNFTIRGSLAGTTPMTFPKEAHFFDLVQESKIAWSYYIQTNLSTNKFGFIMWVSFTCYCPCIM